MGSEPRTYTDGSEQWSETLWRVMVERDAAREEADALREALADERRGLIEANDELSEALHRWRVLTAEADALREALREIAESTRSGDESTYHLRDIARAALGASEAPTQAEVDAISGSAYGFTADEVAAASEAPTEGQGDG